MDSQFMNMEYKECFVGYVDILGFEEIVRQEDHASDVASHLEFLFEEISQMGGLNRPSSKVRAILMSDTFLLYTKDGSSESFQQLIMATAYCVHTGIANSMGSKLKNSIKTVSFNKKLPALFRGAISFGDFYADEKLGIYFGPSYIDAHNWEKRQEWIGIMLTPNCSEFVKSEGWERDEPYLIEYEVPLKENTIKSLCIDWTRDVSDDSIDTTLYEKAEQKHRDKYKNTYDFFMFCKRRKQ